MTQSIKGVGIKCADEFTELLLDVLYALGGDLMPLNLTDRPASYDKFPRALFTHLQQHNSHTNNKTEAVEAAFQEWQSWMLRKARRDSARAEYPQLLKLQKWMVENAEFFTPAALRHLRKSFYGRTYAYLYPRLALIMDFKSYCHEQNIGLDEIPRQEVLSETNKGETTQRKVWVRAVADETFIRENFMQSTGRARAAISKNVGNEYVEQFQDRAIAFLLQHPHYFNSVFAKKN